MDVKKQYLAAFVSLLFTICFGACEGFSSVLLYQLQKPNSTIFVTNEDASWIASIFLLPCPAGSLIVGVLMEIYGRTKILQFAYLPLLLGWAVVSQAETVLMLCVGRFMCGLAVGMEAAAIVYVTEVMIPPAHRSIMLTLLSPIFYVGVAMSYFVGYFLPWRQHAICMSLFAAVGFLLMFSVPETPSWLLSKNKVKESTKSLEWLMNGRGDVREELAKLQIGDNSNAEESGKGKEETLFQAIKSTGAWKPYLIIIVFIFLQQFSGYKMLVFYTVTFYESFGTPIDSYLSSVIFAVLTVGSSLFLTSIINFFNRKTLMVVSATGVCLLCAMSAAHAYLFRNEPTKPIFWLPVACIWLSVIFGTIGLNSLTWIMAGELFPRKVRGNMVGLVWASGFLAMFVSVKIYPTLFSVVQVYGILTLFSVVAFVAIVAAILVLPETRGKSLVEIELLWLPKRK